jgi:potassium-transporting ATPase KdpC subunit
VHNPGVKKEEVPAEMVTASGSGLDPNISLASANIQVKRIAKARDLDESKLKELINRHLNKNPIGPDKINVLQLNVALDAMK